MQHHHSHAVATAMKNMDLEPACRVAAWCAEIAGHLGLPPADRELLERAAMLGSRSKVVVDDEAWGALSRAVGIAVNPVEADSAYAEVREMLRVFHGQRPALERMRRTSLILEQSSDLDSACQLDAMVSAEPDLNGLDAVVGEIAGYLGCVTGADREDAARSLPVFPVVGQRADALLRDENTTLQALESLISSDPALAGHLMAAANSAALPAANRVNSIRQALIRIGRTAARQVALASALRGMFGKKHSHALWNHSLDVADSAARLAARSGLVDSQEAFLAGLVHDVGKLAMLSLPAAAVARRDRLIGKRCPDLVVERVVFGEAHTSLGARILRGWQFTEHMVSAVECHHQPERNSSPLCSILYLAETVAAHDPAIESEWRDELAYQTLAIRRDGAPLLAVEPTVVSGLRFAAVA